MHGGELHSAGSARHQPAMAAHLEVFTIHYPNAKQQLPVNLDDTAHRLLRGLSLQGNPARTESSP